MNIRPQHDESVVTLPGHRGIVFVKEASSPANDTVGRQTEVLRSKLLALIGEDADGILSQLIDHPNDVPLATSTQEQETLRAMAEGVKCATLIEAERKAECAKEEEASPAARFAITHALPALSTIASDASPSKAMKKFIANLPFSETPNAWRLRIGMWKNPHALQKPDGEYGTFGALLNCMQLFNGSVLHGSEYMLRTVNGKSAINGEFRNVETPGLLKIHDWNSFDVPGVGDDNSLSYMYASTMYPTSLSGGNLGHWDTVFREAVIFRDEARAYARKVIDAATNPRLAELPVGALGSYVSQRYDLDAAQTVFERLALCEEVKHGINHMKKERAGGALAFIEQRLASNGLLRRISERVLKSSSPESALSKEFSMIEECDAKLMRMIAGPDPALEVLFTQSQFQSGLAQSDYEHLGQLLCRYTMEESNDGPSMRAHMQNLATLPANELRSLAMHIYTHEFNGSIEDTPFCTIDKEGNLVRHAGTLDEFSEWA